MNSDWNALNHIVKIDPDKDLLPDDSFEDVCATGTDALMIGGTMDVTADKMTRVIEACATYETPLYQEPSNPAVVVDHDALDGYFIPTVLNAGDVTWITGAHKEWVRLMDVDWTRTTSEAYIVLNDDASVATYTQSNCDLDAEDVAAYAEVAEQMFGQSIVYVEYSGMLGDTTVVQSAANALDDATLFYGGGIHDYESAKMMAAHADTIIVGDLVHDKGVDAVAETVDGANDT